MYKRAFLRACLALLALASLVALVIAEIAEWNWSVHFASESLACPAPDLYAEYADSGRHSCNASGWVHGFAVLSSAVLACVMLILLLAIVRWLARPIVYLRGPKTNSFQRDVYDFRTGLTLFGAEGSTFNVIFRVVIFGAIALMLYLLVASLQLHM